ncbi:integrating conjugative element protein [Pseudomonas sp. MDMC216]|uniref:integrating conjugative element protein n=1 Tax=Ectopseudomonas guguanensis TaxID=1198456 RepID=UPI000DC53748|nr:MULTISPECIES: integrating conjugative element protein [Pseudomonas]MDI5993616.1 integrating conjugative element protein [Pseudomonas sp. MDMC216]MDI6005420.1 integrating conjugative element protein [Pseudomonas sp. MDMC17]MPT17047.1 integrating conjugative element protein [Pseudomonas sp.]RAR35235.1 integrating conjugative element protein [Pseudomonas sp. MDMC224]WJH57116.1 integrating conjugative element protein [Pseudomonas guguanensis]
MNALPVLVACLSLAWLPMIAQTDTLIVVDDRGGASALPYYEALNLQPRAGVSAPRLEIPHPPAGVVNEASMLPVRSSRLSPGEVARRVIEAPGLPPFFLVGDDQRSHAWLQQRAPRLRELGAVGLVVNISSAESLDALRALVPELPLSPVAGDDLAERFGLRHYPVLITASGLEQ